MSLSDEVIDGINEQTGLGKGAYKAFALIDIPKVSYGLGDRVEVINVLKGIVIFKFVGKDKKHKMKEVEFIKRFKPQ